MIERFLAVLPKLGVTSDDVHTVFDIGCGDGMRAVGFARAFPHARIYAAGGDAAGGDGGLRPVCERNIRGFPTVTLVAQAAESCRVQEVCGEHGVTAIDLLWIDQRDGGLAVIEAAGPCLETVRCLYTEVAHHPLYGGQPLAGDLDRALSARGFRRCSTIDPSQPREGVVYQNTRPLPQGRRPPVSVPAAAPAAPATVHSEPEAPTPIPAPPVVPGGQTIVIEQPWGGLGDNLQFSTLPELFARRGDRVFVSSRNAIRNPEIHELVWGTNPYVSGVIDGTANAGGGVMAGPYQHLPRYTGFIRRVEEAHGLTPANRFPKLYIQPSIREELRDAIIVDVGSTSVAAPRDHIIGYLRHVFGSFGYDAGKALQVTFARDVAKSNTFRVGNFGQITINSIFEYCEVIASCRVFVTVHSGAQSLAVALRGDDRNPLIHCFATHWQYNQRDYIYDNVEYFVV